MNIAEKIHDHLDKAEDLKDEIKIDMNTLFKNIDFKKLILNPDEVTAEMKQAIEIMVMRKYIPRVVKEGKRFSEDVQR